MEVALAQSNAVALRVALDDLYAHYIACLDEERFEEWPEFFTDPCIYKIIPRMNFDRGLPLATWLCESKGYLQDRVVAIRKTSVYGPRYIRRFVSAIRIVRDTESEIEVRANYAAYETLPDEFTRVFSVGQYRDRIVIIDGRMKFAEKICIFDSELVPNSLIYPL
jgi:3-phenylpropionate/cinnamic acid dioxygenase small subunit